MPSKRYRRDWAALNKMLKEFLLNFCIENAGKRVAGLKLSSLIKVMKQWDSIERKRKARWEAKNV